jgi:6-phosphogluconolactonase
VQLKPTPDPERAASVAADEVAAACRRAVTERGRAVIALSGGETPWKMIRALCSISLPWERIHVAQVDERLVPRGDPRRNLARLEEILVQQGPLPPANLLAMPVESEDPEHAARAYQQTLERRAGTPACLDLVQLGLGTDGHTASLVPGDPVLAVRDRDVAVTAPYLGTQRMTLTCPALSRARQRLWLVTGAGKADRLRQLLDGSGDAPATSVAREDSVVVADADALRGDPSRG